MNVSDEQIFQTKQQLQQQIAQYEQQLQQLIQKQEKLTKIEDLAKSILEYNQLVQEIKDRTQIFSLLASPPSALTSPFVKSELFSYFVAAETIGPELVNFLVDDFLVQVRKEFQSGEYDSIDLIKAEFKEFILPGKIIGEKFEEIDGLINEMNMYCKNIQPDYDPITNSKEVIKYAFEISITADTRMEPTIEAIRTQPLRDISNEDRAELLDKVEEHLAVIRYNEGKNQKIAMDKAVTMLEQKEQAKHEQ